MFGETRNKTPPALLLWGLVLALTGLIAGVFGPIFLDPSVAEGWRIGIYGTGPSGFVLGIALGAAIRMTKLAPWLQWQVLFGCAISLVLGTLYLSTPAPTILGHAIDAQITSCKPAMQATELAIEHWKKTIALWPNISARTGWQADAQRMSSANPGVVLSIKIIRRNTVLEHRKPWNKGNHSASGWHTEPRLIKASKVYFSRMAGNSCASYRLDTNAFYFLKQNNPSQGWPPNDLPNFLSLPVIESIPSEYARLVSR